MQKSPLFITLEGGEGTGKSTLIRSLNDYFVSNGNQVILTREPGGTEGAEAIRDLLVKGSANRWNAMSEICLFYAAREDHITRVIKPALSDGKIVISDRFFDSTRAYQGELGFHENNVINCLEANIVGQCLPNLTLILDIDVNIGLARANSRNDDEGRFEAKKIEFHEKLRQNFLNIAKKEPLRCKVIDASQSKDDVFNEAIKHIASLRGDKNG
ncbi:MAG: dTMP kinase [Caulobacterales bacterium]|nr:dTMP kinase [Caulobacterales bacterium]MCA0373129.1 dTMP kinase [Pseudomonadota bacterium]